MKREEHAPGIGGDWEDSAQGDDLADMFADFDDAIHYLERVSCL